MNIEEIKNTLKKHNSGPIDIKNKFSVLIPIIEIEKELNILYEVRSKNLRNQPGEISFPGGRIEENETPRKTALRETSEELLIDESDIEILMDGDFLINPYHAIIYSSIGKINVDIEKIRPSKDEVDEIFYVPLKYFMENEPKTYELDLVVKSSDDFPYDLIPNGKDYNFKRGIDKVHFYNYKDKIIWGFTAKMTYELIKKLKTRNE